MPRDITIINTPGEVTDIVVNNTGVDFSFGQVGVSTSLSDEYNDNAGLLGYDNLVFNGNADPTIQSDKQAQYALLNSQGVLNQGHVEFIGVSRYDMRGGGAYSPGFATKSDKNAKANGQTSQQTETYVINRSRDSGSSGTSATDSYNGYWLLDPWHYPELEDNDIKKPDMEGDKIALNMSVNIKMESTLTRYEFPTAPVLKYKVNSGTEITASISASTHDDGFGHFYTPINELVTELGTQIPNDMVFTETGMGKLKLTGKDETIILELLPNDDPTPSGWGMLGLTEGTYKKTGNRVTNVTTYDENYHPTGLLDADTLTLSGDVMTGGTPTASNPWIYTLQDDTPQSFTVDLLNVPFEVLRRDWRNTAPHWDMSNAICGNADCPIGRRGFSVSQWIGFIQSGVRTYTVPSLTAKLCSQCGYDLTNGSSGSNGSNGSSGSSGTSGAIQVGGDGMKTYYYKDYFAQDAFITWIIVDSTGTNLSLQTYKGSYSVQIKTSTNDYWETILSVFYSGSEDKYFWIDIDGVEHFEATAPTTWDFRRRRLRARYVRYVSTSDRHATEYTGQGLWDATNKRYNIVADKVAGYFIGCRIETGTVAGTYVNSKTVANSGKDGVQNYVTVEGSIDPLDIYYKITKYEFIGGCAKFEVYGSNYSDSEVKITPPAEIETMLFNNGKTEFTMLNQPTQILGVWAGSTESNVELQPVDEIVASTFRWQTKKFDVTAEDGTVYQFKLLTGGKYYYEYTTNKIKVPSIDQDGDNIYRMNEDVPVDVFSREVTPSIITIKYWQGAGVGVTLDITPDGRGPSYQLEREAINTIVTTMDSLNKSVPLGGNDASYKRDLEWFCYNDNPTIWKPEKKYLTGTELGNNWSIGRFREIFGEHATLVGRKVTGQVTIYGACDTVISGSITVQAPATTTHTIGTYSWTENTGGISEAGFLIEVNVNEAGGERKTLAYSIPDVLIYAKEKLL